MFEISELKEKKLPELQEIAKELNVPKYRTQKKLDLVYQILDYQAANPKAVKAVIKAEETSSETKKRKKHLLQMTIRKKIKNLVRRKTTIGTKNLSPKRNITRKKVMMTKSLQMISVLQMTEMTKTGMTKMTKRRAIKNRNTKSLIPTIMTTARKTNVTTIITLTTVKNIKTTSRKTATCMITEVMETKIPETAIVSQTMNLMV